MIGFSFRLTVSVHLLPLFLLLLCSCQPRHAERTVVVYASIDQVVSEPILKQFETATGIRVLPVYDVEATKTTGLANRLIAEKPHPQADVFLSGEFSQTLLLKNQGVLAAYRSPAAADLPAQFADADGFWTGIGGRARILLVNTRRVPRDRFPRSIFDLLDERWPADQLAIGLPLFGTSATHAAALYAALGPEKARDFYRRLRARGVRVVDGNSVVRNLVVRGDLAFGLTDTDDACEALRNGAPVAIVVPDQAESGLGTLAIPGTAALIARAPHPAEGRQLLDFLLSKAMEEQLAAMGWSQVPLRPSVAAPAWLPPGGFKQMSVNLADVFAQLSTSKKDLTDIFLR
ncbi:MAG: extracellular solute-binding protein [Verrucomicrobia bacterium]|nr:extracellular solute-binding protein [Verrucomicrobiota bacterium]